MALKKTATTEQGFIAVDAYHRVEGIRLNGKSSMTFQIRSYKDNSEIQAFADAAYDAPYDLNGDNPVTQAYEYAKTLQNFADAVNF